MFFTLHVSKVAEWTALSVKSAQGCSNVDKVLLHLTNALRVYCSVSDIANMFCLLIFGNKTYSLFHLIYCEHFPKLTKIPSLHCKKCDILGPYILHAARFINPYPDTYLLLFGFWLFETYITYIKITENYKKKQHSWVCSHYSEYMTVLHILRRDNRPSCGPLKDALHKEPAIRFVAGLKNTVEQTVEFPVLSSFCNGNFKNIVIVVKMNFCASFTIKD